MRRSSKVVGLLAGTVLLVAGCTSTSSGTVTSPSSESSSSQGSAASSASSAAPSNAPGSTPSGSAGPISTGPAPATASSLAPGSTSPVSSSTPVEPSTAVSSAAAVLDAASTKWLTTYCTTILPVTTLTGLQSQISGASGDLTKIKSLFMQAFRTSGGAMTATAAALKGQSAPVLTAAGTDLPGLMSRIGSLGARLEADGAALEGIDPVRQSATLSTALTTHGPDIDKIATVLGTKGGLKVPAKALPEVGRIAACDKVITTD